MAIVNNNEEKPLIIYTFKNLCNGEQWLATQHKFMLVLTDELSCAIGYDTFLKDLLILSIYIDQMSKITQLPLYADTKCYSMELKLLLYTL